MATFMSITDTATLQEEGNDMNHFVSLIVNNIGKYTAAVTRKIKKVKTIIEDYSYPTWGGKESIGKTNYLSEEECIEYYYLNIDKAINSFEDEMLERLNVIREAKKKIVSNSNKGLDIYKSNSQPPLFQKDVPSYKDSYLEDDDIPYDKIQIDSTILDNIVRQFITSSIIIPNASKLDINRWANIMNRLYTDRFENIDNFENFASNYVDFILNDASCNLNIDKDFSEIVAILAYKIIEKLKNLPNNIWINKYIQILDEYVL